MNASLPSVLSRRAFAVTLAVAMLSAALLLLATTAQAQTSAGDPAVGKLLFDDTIAQTGNQTLTGNCTTCHSILSRRNRLGGGEFAMVDATLAQTRIAAAIANVQAMSQFAFLEDTEIRHLAAYIADTPKTNDDELDFAPGAANVAQSLPVDLTNAVTNSTTNATGGRPTVTSVQIVGPDAAHFSITNDACLLQTLPLGGTCRVEVTFSAATTAPRTATLRFTLDPDFPTTAANYTREVALQGTAAGATPTPAPTPGGDGGGAFGLGGLGALAAAAALAAATRRRRGG